MSCEPPSLLAASQKIQAVADNDALYRAAVSRAYYATYHQCRLYYNALPHLSSAGGKGVHEELINRLLEPSAKLTSNGRARSRTLGKYLREVCDARVHADYFKPAEGFTQEKMDATLTSAKLVFDCSATTKGPL